MNDINLSRSTKVKSNGVDSAYLKSRQTKLGLVLIQQLRNVSFSLNDINKILQIKYGMSSMCNLQYCRCFSGPPVEPNKFSQAFHSGILGRILVGLRYYDNRRVVTSLLR